VEPVTGAGVKRISAGTLTVAKNITKPPLLNLSVEEENLAAIPFAVLERRVGKRVGKIEIKGTKTTAEGKELEVLWQIQGNNDLGLPTEQDLDIFVALGVLTFRANFAKRVAFTGREIARILNISSVHGKFYQRLKLAMDRFIPLRFRALTATDEQEEVKWCNVFQEASFSLNRTTGRCTGTVTWTDKLIQSMDSGFFRLLDAGRYMDLDGLTAKHLYRFLAVEFEKTDLVVIDARKLATEHLGIFNLPVYFSRLLQTLEPAFDQLVRIQVLASYCVADAEKWRVAVRRHPAYVPERKSLLAQGPGLTAEAVRLHSRMILEKAGLPAKAAAGYAERFSTREELYQLQRGARLVEEIKTEGVHPHTVLSLIRKALDADLTAGEGRDQLDWCEIALEVCRQKRKMGQALWNLAGLLVKIARDPDGRERLVSPDAAEHHRRQFRERERLVLRHAEQEEERQLILEYEDFRQRLAVVLLAEMAEPARQLLRKEKTETLRQQDRYEKIPHEVREQEIEQLILQDLGRREAPPFEKWRLRKKAQQAVLPFGMPADDPQVSQTAEAV